MVRDRNLANWRSSAKVARQPLAKCFQACPDEALINDKDGDMARCASIGFRCALPRGAGRVFLEQATGGSVVCSGHVQTSAEFAGRF